MPLLSTRGGLSSRGFGQFSGGKATTLRTYTFPIGSSVFTVPATTNALVSAVGAGADGTPGGTTTGGFDFVRLVVSAQAFGVGIYGPPTGAQLQAILAGTVSVFNGGGTVYTNREYWGYYPNNKYDVISNYDTVVTRVVPNTTTGFITPVPPAGEIPYPDPPIYTMIIQYQAYFDYPDQTGAATTGFGLTFPGGTGGASSTTTFNNVAVTPNQTYVINNNKSLTITYYA